MEHRSQKTSYALTLLLALFALAPLGAAELTYQVRRQGALHKHAGVLTIGETGVRYAETAREGKRHAAERFDLDYRDIQELWVSPDKLVLTTYQDRKWRLGADRQFTFLLAKGATFESACQMLGAKLDRRFVAAVASAPGNVQWELPVKLLGTIQGSEGLLQVSRDSIVYKTERPRQSRTWRFQDIENVSTSDPYQLTITTYERAPSHYGSRKGFNFQAKQPLDEKRFDALWRRINQDRGLHLLTAIEERNPNTK